MTKDRLEEPLKHSHGRVVCLLFCAGKSRDCQSETQDGCWQVLEGEEVDGAEERETIV